MQFHGKLNLTREGTAVMIPTRGRVHNQVTLDRLPEHWRKLVVLVCPPEEVKYHEQYNWGVSYLTFEHRDIGQVRQTMFEFLKENKKVKRYFFMDDDMEFYIRKTKDDWRLRYADPREVGDLLTMLESWLVGGLKHVGISVRQGNNFGESDASYIGRIFGFSGHDMKVLREHPELRWDATPPIEDFNMTLSLLRLGHPNCITWRYAWGQKASNAPGGCSTWRTKEIQENAARKLASLHPEFVKLVEKNDKTDWGKRVDVRIQWAKAFKSSGATLPPLPEWV